MNAGVLILVLIVWLIFDGLMAHWFYEAAEAKGYHDRKYFHIAFWFGIAGYLLVIALPDRGNGAVATAEGKEETGKAVATSEVEEEAEKEEDWSDMEHSVGFVLPANIPSPVRIVDSKSNVLWEGEAGEKFRFEADSPVSISVVWEDQCRASALVQPRTVYQLCDTAIFGTKWEIFEFND